MSSGSHLILGGGSKSKESRVQLLCRVWGQGRESQQAVSVDSAFLTFLAAVRKELKKAKEGFALALCSPQWLGRHGGRSLKQLSASTPRSRGRCLLELSSLSPPLFLYQTLPKGEGYGAQSSEGPSHRRQPNLEMQTPPEACLFR